MVAHHGKYIAYLRVSTQAQGADGYGIDAQRAAVRQRLDGGRWTLVSTFIEVESGIGPDRRGSRPGRRATTHQCAGSAAMRSSGLPPAV
jgi:DNA invertase Pin-like site-specific DNA recombinase